MTASNDSLHKVASAVRERFDAARRVLSFQEFIAMVETHPERHCRDAACYVRDCFDHFGTYEVERPWGATTRYRLFDLEFDRATDDADRRDHLVGQERIQESVYRTLSNFVREGRANRLVLMHGPNGSSKSTFAACVMRGLEQYSALDEGALYRFSWIFTRGKDGKTIGFGSTEDARSRGSLAHLADHQIDVKLVSELREHPLLLLPREDRLELVNTVYKRAGNARVPDWIARGQLGAKNRAIFEALLTAYRGDLEKVLDHVQIERYFVSRRYRTGAVTIGPQMAVDASERQITADMSLNQLPASLSALRLYEAYGELVDAAGGVIEYSDLLKRPLDAWKYLLLAIETGEVSLPLSTLPINSVMIASSNELHLNAFREHPEYNSFRGRLSLVRVPYLLDFEQEQQIYDSQIVPRVQRHVAPHATFVAALWAVLTRLRRPHADRYSEPQLGRVAADLTPLEKADLYSNGSIPERLSPEDAKVLRSGIERVCTEFDSVPVYEGLTGASPREIRTLLLDAAQDPQYECLSPLAVLARIEAFCQRNDYEFLREAPDRGYQDHRGFLRQVRNRWLDAVDDELRASTGLIDEAQYADLFDRYVVHVSNWVKKERVYNPMTGAYENPDVELMGRIEKQLEAGAAEDFRRNLISVVAAYAIDNPGSKPEYARLFPRYIDRLRESYYGERRKQITTILEDILALIEEGPQPPADRMGAAKTALERMKSTYGYDDESARDALRELRRDRYLR